MNTCPIKKGEKLLMGRIGKVEIKPILKKADCLCQCEKHHPMLLLLKLGLCPPVPNRNAETEFWVKEEKSSVYCFARERRSQQANALKTVPLFGREQKVVL